MHGVGTNLGCVHRLRAANERSDRLPHTFIGDGGDTFGDLNIGWSGKVWRNDLHRGCGSDITRYGHINGAIRFAAFFRLVVAKPPTFDCIEDSAKVVVTHPLSTAFSERKVLRGDHRVDERDRWEDEKNCDNKRGDLQPTRLGLANLLTAFAL